MKEQIQIHRDEAALKILDDAELEAAVGGATSDVVDAVPVCSCACGYTACGGGGTAETLQ